MPAHRNETIPTFTPTMLATFERCPYQFYRKYVMKHLTPLPFNRDLACGTAAHAVIQGVLECYSRTGGYPINLRGRIEDALTTTAYPEGADWAMDVERVLAWVKTAVASIEETARVVMVERWLEYPYPGDEQCPPFRLRHRIGVVLQQTDRTLEHRDWKTGCRTEVDELQNVAARIVVRQAFPDHPRIRSSTAFLTQGLVATDELTREQVRSGWLRIKRLAAQIMSERDWLPVSNGLCPWCPLYQRGCPLYGSPDENPGGTTDWLEGVA